MYNPDPAMSEIIVAFDESGLTLEDLGIRAGYPRKTARMSAWQFLKKTDDPRLSVMRRFARALGLDVSILANADERK